MAYVAPTSRATGFVVTKNVWNQDVVDNMIAVAGTTGATVALATVTPAADRLPYFTGASTATVTTLSSFSRTLLDDTTAAAWFTTLGTIPLQGATADPAEREINFDTADGVAQVGFSVGRVRLCGILTHLTSQSRIDTSAAETALMSASIPANKILTGQSFRVVIQGNYLTTGTPTLTVKLKYGTAILQTTSFTTESGAPSTTTWRQEYDICFRSVGASGAAIALQTLRQFGTAVAVGVKQETVSAVTVDTTATKNLEVTAQWGTASASNIITADIGKIIAE